MMVAHDAIITNHINQTFHANKPRQEGKVYSPGDLVYLSTQNLSLPKGRARKLLPKYIGPYKIIEVYEKTSNVKLKLPPELVARRITPTFHINLVRPHVPNDDERFPHRDTTSYYDFGGTDEPEWFVDEIIAHHWISGELEPQVRWTLGDVTWEPLASCKELEALDNYLVLHGVTKPHELSRKNNA